MICARSIQEPASRGFTLIELLIVIAIILVLIAIALPNFLEAQIRAKVTKAKGEIRSLGIAMEAYYLDFKVYPAQSEENILNSSANRPWKLSGLKWLTTPIHYLTAVPEDPFSGDDQEIVTYEMGGCKSIRFINGALETWAIMSRGPRTLQMEGDDDIIASGPHYKLPDDGVIDSYNPTNGTASRGDIFLFGGDSFFVGVKLDSAYVNMARNPTFAANGGRGLNVNSEWYLHRMPPPLK
jgi:type II secretion system protein G